MAFATHFLEIAALIGIATAIAFAMRLLRQPLIIGHILTGLLVGPFVLDLVRSAETLQLFGELGIAFLLFTVGLGLSPHVLKTFGRIAVVTGVGQVLFTTLAGFAICMALGMGMVPALYVAVALAFSSTIIILKLIADRGDLDKLYAKIAIGFLLVQDLIAIVLLFAVPVLSGSANGLQALLGGVLEGVVLGAGVVLVAKHVIGRMHRYLEGSHELLFLFATAWGMGVAGLFWSAGFSLESGALIAGVALATLPSRHEIAARLLPLKDFFIVAFFIYLGSQMALGDLAGVLVPALILSLLVLVGNPVILMVIMGLLGYRRRTSLQTGLTVAQISEFSLILVALGVSLGHVEPRILSLVTLVGIITIFGSTYMILHGDTLYRWLHSALSIFERKDAREPRVQRESYDAFLFGGGRIGMEFVELFARKGHRFLVVEHDPEIVAELRREGVAVEYGDAGDVNFLEDIGLHGASIVVSTIPELETNLIIVEEAKRANPRCVVIAVTHRVSNALELYETGADYAILPHFLGARYAANLAERYAGDLEALTSLRKEHLEKLRKIAEKGIEHPILERYR